MEIKCNSLKNKHLKPLFAFWFSKQKLNDPLGKVLQLRKKWHPANTSENYKSQNCKKPRQTETGPSDESGFTTVRPLTSQCMTLKTRNRFDDATSIRQKRTRQKRTRQKLTRQKLTRQKLVKTNFGN